MLTWVLVETAKLQIEELLMGHRNRVPISHKFNFSHKILQHCQQRYILQFSEEPVTLL